MRLTFTLDEEQWKKLDAWEKEQDAKALAEQRATIKAHGAMSEFHAALAENGTPYYGATGGSLTFHFSPNSIGMWISVTHGWTKAEIDLSDYENW
jgi:hypothetical protein